MNQNPRVAIPVFGVAIAVLVWLFATAMSPDRMVSAEFVAMEGGLILVALIVGILWPQPVVVPPPLTEDQLAALLDRRYLRTEFSLPAHSHDGVYAEVGHTHPGYAAEAHTHPELEHQLPDHDHDLDPAATTNTGGVRELIDEPPPVVVTPGRRPYRRT